jgi:hypothetical protein
MGVFTQVGDTMLVCSHKVTIMDLSICRRLAAITSAQ